VKAKPLSARAKKARARATARRRHLLVTYGITQEQYDTMFEAQGGVCAICGGKRRYLLAVDHCHKTGRVRGLLCKLCNGRILTAAKDDPAILRRAADYLELPPAFAVIGEHVVPNHDVLKVAFEVPVTQEMIDDRMVLR
jgi:hypothetical protein